MPARYVLGDGEGQVTAVLAGCGIAQLPTWLISRQLEDGTLVEVLPHLATEGLAINLVWTVPPDAAQGQCFARRAHRWPGAAGAVKGAGVAHWGS